MAIVTSTSNAAINHTGKPDRALTGVAALFGAGSEWVAGRRIGLAQFVDQPQEVGNFNTRFCSWDDSALTSLIALPFTAPTRNRGGCPEPDAQSDGRGAEGRSEEHTSELQSLRHL